MELVKGVPITQFCDDNRLNPRERLQLFIPVCHAIQHAHQKGIIHRDLKPSNVLVAQFDDKPVPKVIDFGVAKATGQKLTDRTTITQFGQFVGTLEYMSPEQASFNALDIDTRSDTYSLGVLLYELLTGSTPFEKKRLQDSAFDEMLRIIREEEPPKPSTRLSTTEELPSIAAYRNTEPAKLGRLVKGDLDWIVMKALEKDRDRRYETANGLAMDLERHLADEPVRACPPSVSYRLRKFARRHKASLATAALLVAALVLGSAISIWQAIEATAARDAEAQARRDESAAKQLAEYRADAIARDLEQLNTANGLIESGRLHAEVAEWAKGESQFSQGVICRPDSSHVWTERAGLYLRLGLWDLAAADLAQALDRQGPSSTNMWYHHALLCLHVGDIQNINGIQVPDGSIVEPAWQPISPVLSNNDTPSNGYITALAIAPSDPQTIYAATRDGKVWVTTKGGGLGTNDWVEMDAGLFYNKDNNPNGAFGQVWQFLINPTNAKQVFAVTNDSGRRNVWYLDPESAKWQNLSGDFPWSLLSRTMYVDWRFKIPVLYVGTTRGVYQSVNFGTNWKPFGNFLPNTQAEDLQGLPDKNILAAGTFGRGAWEISIPPSSVTGSVYLDLDGDGTLNAQDHGLAGVLVYLDVNGSGVPAPNEYRTLTDAQGNYSFPMVPSSTYTVRVALPPEFVSSTPSAYRLTLAGSRETRRDFRVLVPDGLQANALEVLQNQVAQIGQYLEQALEEAEQAFRMGLLGGPFGFLGDGNQDQPPPISTFSLSDFNMPGGVVNGQMDESLGRSPGLVPADEPPWLLADVLQGEEPLWLPSLTRWSQ
jgi:hypothetical protein